LKATEQCAKKFRKACQKDRECKKKEEDKKDKCQKKCKKESKTAWQDGQCTEYVVPVDETAEAQKECQKTWGKACIKEKKCNKKDDDKKKECKQKCVKKSKKKAWQEGQCTEYVVPVAEVDETAEAQKECQKTWGKACIKEKKCNKKDDDKKKECKQKCVKKSKKKAWQEDQCTTYPVAPPPTKAVLGYRYSPQRAACLVGKCCNGSKGSTGVGRPYSRARRKGQEERRHNSHASG